MDCSSKITTADPAFWSASYHGKQIAASQHSRSWVVYIDRVMQANRIFASIEEAIGWLERKVDDDAFDSRAGMFRDRRRERHRAPRRMAA